MSLVAAGDYETVKPKKSGNAKHRQAANKGTSTCNYSKYTHATQKSCLSASPSPPVDLPGLSDHSRPTISGVDFAMVLFKGRTTEVIHTYSSMQCSMTLAPWLLDDLTNWRTSYPLLTEYHEQGQISCPIFLFDTSLSLMEGMPGCNAMLSIESSLDVDRGACYTNWQSYTRFYDECGHPIDLAKFYKGSGFEEVGEALRPFEVFPGKRSLDCTLKGLPLKSLWWARTFSNIIGQIDKARTAKDPRAIKIEVDNTERYIRGISVMQEIYASAHESASKPEKVAILLWKFSKSHKGEAATTTWRKLIPPASPFQVQSSAPPQPQPLLTLDTRIQSAVPEPSAMPYGGFYNPQQPLSMFVDTPEEPLDAGLSEGSSRRTTPPSDHTSFPSSTSSSFPLNFSNPGFPLSLSQDSSFSSQESTYASFGSQESQYHTQNLVTRAQEVHESQPDIYPAQDTLYHPQDSTQLYNWPASQTLVLEDHIAAANQDFTSGKIQLTYPAMYRLDESNLFQSPQPPLASDYETHLFAPRATLPPQHQHQLIQHPEQFDQHEHDIEPELVSDIAVPGATAEEEEIRESVEEDSAGDGGQQCAIDWQLISEQSMDVESNLRFQEAGMADANIGEEDDLEELVNEGVEGEQGYVLAEIVEEEESAVEEK